MALGGVVVAVVVFLAAMADVSRADGKCCYAAGCQSCNPAGNWCDNSQANCEGQCHGTWCPAPPPPSPGPPPPSPPNPHCKTQVVAGALNVSIDGKPTMLYVAQSGNATSSVKPSGTSLAIEYNARMYFVDRCIETFDPDAFYKFQLLGKTLSYTVDLTGIHCGCVAAFYLVKMPAYSSSQKPDKTKCDDYYCDANNVCGVFCPEMDIMEANTAAMAVTPHKCDAPSGLHYNNCDRGGCGKNTKTMDNVYGPGTSFTVDTTKSFRLAVSFQGTAELENIVTTVSQGSASFQIDHASCGSYLGKLTDAFKAGMTVAISSWGGQGSQVSWLDVPPCPTSTNCAGTGTLTFSNITVADNIVEGQGRL
eukprot:m.39400 g.39400  ORF g.39400 m.39400 type:complete len:364 (-) comp11268_c0_seq1:127-1218(-)